MKCVERDAYRSYEFCSAETFTRFGPETFFPTDEIIYEFIIGMKDLIEGIGEEVGILEKRKHQHIGCDGKCQKPSFSILMIAFVYGLAHEIIKDRGVKKNYKEESADLVVKENTDKKEITVS